ncbi:MAG: hypothetical protein A3D16_17105 [Rhodobacterales bacterium RIFCSPHIGHO2_02_FULL_62_130]|jgi:hypothetical protein|nr:MAG: hypothetical protein A3D16_17105 [Rhodobacterales bacterium RIFCSPHIGHO2_02_FULL_62_130]OHC60668.1 MAG: hypothetical protein A3E48_13735 [Rhodobacterales bacterium RIFCSPHIGHO2_12_FULL_62_75]
MRIVYHLGAHFTDEERLLKCLLKNRDVLAQHDIVVPAPKRYRALLRETAIALKGQAATRDNQALILEQIMEEDHADRLILSWDSFLSLPPWVLKDTLYPAAGERVRAFSQIFPEIEAEFHLAIRNPATFLPALYDKQRQKPYQDFLAGADPFDLRWSDVVERILDSNPDAPLTIWCDEDTPLIWPEVLQAVAGLPDGVRLDGEDDLLLSLMSTDGMTRLRAYLESHPPATVLQRRKIVSAFLDKFALPDRIDMQIDMPGWTEDSVAELSHLYEEDVARIAQMAEVTFLAP